MGFSRQDYWSGLPCPPSGDLPDPRIEPESLTSPVLAGRFFTNSATRETHSLGILTLYLYRGGKDCCCTVIKDISDAASD